MMGHVQIVQTIHIAHVGTTHKTKPCYAVVCRSFEKSLAVFRHLVAKIVYMFGYTCENVSDHVCVRVCLHVGYRTVRERKSVLCRHMELNAIDSCSMSRQNTCITFPCMRSHVGIAGRKVSIRTYMQKQTHNCAECHTNIQLRGDQTGLVQSQQTKLEAHMRIAGDQIGGRKVGSEMAPPHTLVPRW